MILGENLCDVFYCKPYRILTNILNKFHYLPYKCKSIVRLESTQRESIKLSKIKLSKLSANFVRKWFLKCVHHDTHVIWVVAVVVIVRLTFFWGMTKEGNFRASK